MRILLVEDDAMVGKAVRKGLIQAGFAVDWVTDGRGAELALSDTSYALVILDLGLPKKDGMSLLVALRSAGNDVPVLVTSARDGVSDRIAGLEAGADDYVLKPFDLDELTSRVRALLRRTAGSGSAWLRSGCIMLDTTRKAVLCNGATVELSPMEYSVLETLMHRPGMVLSREQLEEAVYGWGKEVASNAIEVHLHNLRKKLGPGSIENLRGLGYRVCGD